VRRRALVAGAALYLAAFSFMAWTCAFHSTATYGFFDVATWVQKNTAEDEVIGVFQGGAIGYFSGRRVINLDGKVNHEAGAALRDGRLEEYVERCGVDLIMDDHKVLELFFGPWDREEYRRVFSRAACTGADVGVPGWLGYRLPTPHGQRASAAGPAGPTSAP
jgi:hypothetical protein